MNSNSANAMPRCWTRSAKAGPCATGVSARRSSATTRWWSRSRHSPWEAARECGELVHGLVADLLGHGESSIRLLPEGVEDQASMHLINVTMLCLLLGKALRLPSEQLHNLGTAAFLHDIGKTQLPDKVRWIDHNFSPAEYKQYQGHVAHGVLIAKQRELSLANLHIHRKPNEYACFWKYAGTRPANGQTFL